MSQVGFEPGIFCSRGGRLNHWTSEAVCVGDGSRCSEEMPLNAIIIIIIIILTEHCGSLWTNDLWRRFLASFFFFFFCVPSYVSGVHHLG